MYIFTHPLPQGSFKQRLAALAPQDAIVWGDLFPKQYCVTDLLIRERLFLSAVVIMWGI